MDSEHLETATRKESFHICWGKGYGTEAMNLILGFAFRDLNLNRVQLEAFDFNKRAQKCYLKVGFKEVGRRRKTRFIDGKYRDCIVMDILREEWQQGND